MRSAKYIGHVGVLAVAAVLVGATVVPASVLPASPVVELSADSTALILGGTTAPTPDHTYIDIVKNQYIVPTHPGQTIDYVAVTTPEESWPLTGVLRLVGSALGDPRLFGAGGAAWPDEPWWKLSGLFDLTLDRSIQAGVADLQAEMAAYGNDHLVIYGLSQGAVLANVEKQDLAAKYPAGTTAPDIDFVLQGDENLPNGGLLARFAGLTIPILEWSFNGAAATDTQFDTIEINREYDGFADFPLYPVNVLADLNAVLGILYRHTNSFDVSLPSDPSTSPAYQGTHGDTTYYFFQTQNLPLFDPLRALGVPESLIDVVEPFFKVLVDLGYDRSIAPWEPTPARLIPALDPGKVVADLMNAVGEGVGNTAALFGAPPLANVAAPLTLAAPTTRVAAAEIPEPVSAADTVNRRAQALSMPASMDRAPSTTDKDEDVSADVAPRVDPVHEKSRASQSSSATTVGETADTSDSSTTTSTPEPAHRVGQPALELVISGSVEVNGSRPTWQSVDAGPATVGSSSANSSAVDSSSTGSGSTGNSSSDGDSSGGHADDS